MKKPIVAVVGRPNVGKSTLFNLLTETRKSLVKNQPGVTRDLIIEEAELWGKHFDLVDTGGITESKDLIQNLVREQVVQYLKSVDLILFVVDGRDGLIPEDRDVHRIVRESGKPHLIIANKVDRLQEEELKKTEFYEFSDRIFAASFEQRRGLTDFLEELHRLLPESESDPSKHRRLAVVGKPNVGKSSLINWILGENRVLVSEVAGTTVDAVEVPLRFLGRDYLFVDTAGLRKSAQRHEDVEILSAFKSQEAIQRADLILLVIDSVEGPTDQDARILQSILEAHRAVIVVASKSDLAKGTPYLFGSQRVETDELEFKQRFRERCERVFHFFPDVEIVFISTLEKTGLPKLFRRIEDTFSKLEVRISTSDLNDFFMETIRKAPAPVWGSSNVKFYYLTQTQQEPPSFIAFANHPEGVDNAYRRFLTNQIKARFHLQGIPIRLFAMRSRGR